MTKILRAYPLIIVSLLLSSCLMPNEKGKVSLSLSSSDQAARDGAKDDASANVSVTDVKLINDQIVITGSDLDGVTKAQLTQSGSDSLLSIVSQSASQLILSSSSTVALALNTLMSLTLEDAYGATVISVTFELPDSSVSTAKIGDDQVTSVKIADGAITATKLASMSAAIGQLLRWNGTTWVASDLDALTFAGTWDASLGDTNPNVSAVGGEYYIVSADGTADPGDGNSRAWFQGDWIVYNDNTSSWDQIRNTSDVTSFNTRTGAVIPESGDYTWAQINKTTSSIGDIADVDLTTPPTSGKVLKFDGTNWIADDDLSGGGAGSVTSTEISDGSITNDDINGSAVIDYAKLNIADGDLTIAKTSGLQTALDGKLDLAGGTMTGNIAFSGAQTVDGVDVSNLETVASNNTSAISTNASNITTNSTDIATNASGISTNASAISSLTKSDVGLGNVDNISRCRYRISIR